MTASSVNAGKAMAAVASSNAVRTLDEREIMIAEGGYAGVDGDKVHRSMAYFIPCLLILH